MPPAPPVPPAVISPLRGRLGRDGALARMLALSLAIHAVAIVLFLFPPWNLFGSDRPAPVAYTVDLVASDRLGGSAAPKSAPGAKPGVPLPPVARAAEAKGAAPAQAQAKQAEVKKQAEAKKQAEVEAQKQAKAKAEAETKAKAEAAKKQAETQAKAQAEAKAKAEAAAKALALKKAAEQKKADEQKKAAAAKKAAEEKKAAEAKQAEEARKAEEAKKQAAAEAAQRKAEEAKKAEAAKQAAAAKKAEEDKKAAAAKAAAEKAAADKAAEEKAAADAEAARAAIAAKIRNDHLAAAVERLRGAAAENEAEGGTGLGGSGGGGVVQGLDFLLYKGVVENTIRQNWAWAGESPGLKVVVGFGIQPDGRIVDLAVVEPSGDTAYDNLALRAVQASDPLPPPPEAYQADFARYELELRAEEGGL